MQRAHRHRSPIGNRHARYAYGCVACLDEKKEARGMATAAQRARIVRARDSVQQAAGILELLAVDVVDPDRRNTIETVSCQLVDLAGRLLNLQRDLDADVF